MFITRREFSPQDKIFQKPADRDADGVHDDVAPLEREAEDEANQFDVAKLVNPIGLIEFTDFDGVGDGESSNQQAAGRG